MPGRVAVHRRQVAPDRPLLCFCSIERKKMDILSINPSLISFSRRHPPTLSLWSILLRAPPFIFPPAAPPLSYSFSLLVPEPLSSLKINPCTCCGDSRSYCTQTMRENKSSITKTQNKGQSKALYSTIDFTKINPLYMRRSVSFYWEADGFFTFRGYPHAKKI
jgi:hypothetical protein